MRDVLASMAKSLALGVGLLVFMVIIIQGWPIAVTVLGTATAFGVAGFIDARWQRVPRWYYTVVVSLPFLALFMNGPGLALGAHLLVTPGQIDYRNFYALLPLVSLAGLCVGAFVGRVTRRPSPATHARAAT